MSRYPTSTGLGHALCADGIAINVGDVLGSPGLGNKILSTTQRLIPSVRVVWNNSTLHVNNLDDLIVTGDLLCRLLYNTSRGIYHIVPVMP